MISIFYLLFIRHFNYQICQFTWEQCKLGDLGKTQSGIGFPDSEQGGQIGIPFYKVSDMNTEGNEHVMLTANHYVTSAQIAKRGWKPIDAVPAIMFAKVGAAVMLNRKRLISKPFLLDNNTMAYSFDGKLDKSFGKSLFDTIYLPSLVQVGALPSYNATDINELEVKVPKLDEQSKVGLLFSNIDNLITLHQRKFYKNIERDFKMQRRHKLFVDYYENWIKLYKEGAVKNVTLKKYYLTLGWLKKLVPNLKTNELTRTIYQQLLNDYAKHMKSKQLWTFITNLKDQFWMQLTKD